jgi:pyruvate dehydrogenase E2 component (dihydrolipoyllysine-residue acetyltransferase)
MSQFKMPSLGADMEAGKLTEWLVKPGDAVKHGDIVAVVETQKGAIEIEIFEDGTVQSLLVQPGATVPVGTPMAEIRGLKEAPAPLPTPAPPASRPAAVPPPPSAMPAPSPVAAAGEIRVSPAARKLAAEKGIDLAGMIGSGPGGSIVFVDVEAALRAAAAPAAKPPTPEKPAAGGVDLGAMRTAIAAAMARSKREIPHYYLEHSIDMTAAQDWLARTNESRPPAERLLAGALLAKATALALRRFPEFNGFYEDGRFRPSTAIHVGIAIAIRGGGLVAPAIHDTATLSLDAVMAALRDLTARVRAGRFRGSELSDPTITLSSLGERGVEALYAVIYPPQVAILGMGKVVERPWVVDGAVRVRAVLTATLSADHRVSDGHKGALLLREIDALLQKPEAL